MDTIVRIAFVILVIFALIWSATVGIPHLLDVAKTYSFQDDEAVIVSAGKECWQYPGGEIKNRIQKYYAPYQQVIVKTDNDMSGIITGDPEALNSFRSGDYLRVVVDQRTCWIQVDSVTAIDN